MAKHHITMTVNGDEYEFLCDTEQTLLDCLRDELFLTGTKEGCGSGDCGACSVVVDGRLMCACLMLGVEMEGSSIETIEGMADGETLHPLQQKFLELNGLQCGICTGHPDCGEEAAGREPGPDGNRGSLLSGRQSVSMHRL